MEALGHKVTREILFTLDRGPMSARGLTRALGLPQSTVYFNLHRLQRLGLVGVDQTSRTGKGRAQALFRSQTSMIWLPFRTWVTRLSGRDIHPPPRVTPRAGRAGRDGAATPSATGGYGPDTCQ